MVCRPLFWTQLCPNPLDLRSSVASCGSFEVLPLNRGLTWFGVSLGLVLWYSSDVFELVGVFDEQFHETSQVISMYSFESLLVLRLEEDLC